MSPVGFVGLGIMGRPMALRLAAAGTPLVVWNRSDEAVRALTDAGARAAASVAEVFAACDTVIVMLRNEHVVDTVLRAGDSSGPVAPLVAGRTVVNMGTLAPEASARIARDVEAAGGVYVEAPVSGSRRPAEQGELVAMIASPSDAVSRVAPLIAPMCARVVPCGPVPGGLTMKLAVNVFLIATMTGLAETFHFADAHGVDRETLRDVLDSGQMASAISRVKTAKLVADDLAPQAAISDVLMNAELIRDAARAAGIAVPLTDAGRDLYVEAADRGDGGLDAIGVVRAFA
ncbi:NAD(P)-dependent oxidoreductase [Microbacterium awajiense]|uniref:NAD(P)-dependent oxidoreductase n=1 Tax=Microbacterium awajiense TaxID=415214 RepID=A0ABP7A105_9MICO